MKISTNVAFKISFMMLS